MEMVPDTDFLFPLLPFSFKSPRIIFLAKPPPPVLLVCLVLSIAGLKGKILPGEELDFPDFGNYPPPHYLFFDGARPAFVGKVGLNPFSIALLLETSGFLLRHLS